MTKFANAVAGTTDDHPTFFGADAVILFMQELLDSVETPNGIAKEHGSQTLTDLMYLQSPAFSALDFNSSRPA